jgi:catechol 2,3-dioxygenase-like lactoylglutathione lyase family enzyme
MTRHSLDHTSICVSDVERSRQFYEGLLGLTVTERPNFGFAGMWYQLGEGQLHLIQRERARMTGDPSAALDPTDPHFAIQVDDLDGMRGRLRAAGLEILDFGGEQLWVRDPDGNTVELRAPAGPRR